MALSAAFKALCIDDDPLALDQLRSVLERLDAPLSCSYYGSAKRALQAQRESSADIVVCDLRLGSTTGIKLISQMQLQKSDTLYILLSGEADLQSALSAMNEIDAFRFFTKPARIQNVGIGVLDAINELNLRRLRSISGSTLSVLDKMPIAVATVDDRGHLHYANAAAHRIFGESGFFDLGEDRVLRSKDPRETRRFHQFLAGTPMNEAIGEVRTMFRFSLAERNEPITVTAIAAGDGHPPLINIIISDPATKGQAPPERLAIALGITPSEARVVHGLVEGGNVEDAARAAGVSISTARTYLKNVFSKTGVSRQAELVRLALLTAA